MSPLSTPSVETEILHYPRKRNLEQYTVAVQVSRTNGRTNSRRECGYRFSIKFSTVAWSITSNMRGVSPRLASSRLSKSRLLFERGCWSSRCALRVGQDVQGNRPATFGYLSTAESVRADIIKMLREGEIFLLDIKNFIILSVKYKEKISLFAKCQWLREEFYTKYLWSIPYIEICSHTKDLEVFFDTLSLLGFEMINCIKCRWSVFWIGTIFRFSQFISKNFASARIHFKVTSYRKSNRNSVLQTFLYTFSVIY